MQATTSTSAGKGPTDKAAESPQAHGLQTADVVFGIAVVVIAVIRFMILREGGAPATIDAGNWLAFGDALFGADTRSPTIVYPPVVPLLTKGFVEAFGLINGVAAFGAIASVAPALGFYVALRSFGLGVEVLPGALLVLGASAVGEATAWGGFPQLLGLGLLVLALCQLDRWISSGRRADAALTGLLVMALFATTHFVGIAFGVASLVILALGYPRLRGHDRPWTAWAVDVLLIVAPAVWLLPLYLDLAGAFSGDTQSFRFLNQLTWSNVMERIEFLYRDFPSFWRIALPLTVLTPLVLAGRRSSPVWRVLVAVLVSSAGLALATREGRFLYLATLAVALAVTLWFQALREVFGLLPGSGPAPRGRRVGRWALVALFVGVATWQMIAGTDFFREQRNYYGIVTPGLLEGLERIRDDTPADSILAVASIRDAPLGWWVEAITDRKTYYSSALRWLSYADELERAGIGNEIFSRTFPDASSVAVAEEHRVDYLIVPTRWAHFDPDLLGPASEVSRGAWLAVDDVVILEAGELPAQVN